MKVEIDVRKISGFAMWIMALWLVVACEAATAVPTAMDTPTVAVTPIATSTATTAPYPPPRATVPPFTPAPTQPTPTPSLTHAPVSNIPLASIYGQLPVTGHDLLFIRDNTLMRWLRGTNSIELLSASYAFSVSADGERVAFARRVSPDKDEIAVLDLSTRQVKSIARVNAIEPAPIYWRKLFALSPDSKWVSYVQNGSLPPFPFPPPTPSKLVTDTIVNGTVFAASVENPERAISLGNCTSGRNQTMSLECLGVWWSPNNRRVAWSDWQGVWVGQVGAPARMVIANTLAHEFNEKGVWRLRAWSPNSRYLLAQIGKYEGSNLGVLDVETGRAAGIPNTLEYAGPYASATWVDGEHLFIVRGNQNGSDLATADLWRVNATGAELLTRERSVAVGANSFTTARGATAFSNGRVGFALLGGPNDERGLFIGDSKTMQFHKAADLPLSPRDDALSFADVVWSADGTDTIVRGVDIGRYSRPDPFDLHYATTLYVSTSDGTQYDLAQLIVNDAHDFVWSR